MKLLIKSARIIDPSSSHHNKKRDIVIESGRIKQIGTDIKVSADTDIIEHTDLHVSPGWFDFRASFGEPGLEHKETIETGLKAAIQGGFTGVLLNSATQPAIQSRTAIEYILRKSQSSMVDVHVCGALSINRGGEELTEMFDMKQGGAVAISDDFRPVMNSGLMQRAMQYANNVGLPVLSFPYDKSLNPNGIVNESLNTTYLGFKGSPTLSELLMVNRDIALSEYLNIPIHVGPVSSMEAIKAIEAARKKNIPVTCEVSSVHVLLDDSMLSTFDSNYKVNPPLRGKKDVAYIIKAIASGIVQVISSCHYPHEIESKQTEFDYAAFGIINLQTSYSLVNEALLNVEHAQEHIVNTMAIQPRKILQLEVPSITEDAMANITCFSPSMEWQFTEKLNKSRSANSPFFNRILTGKAVAVVKNKLVKLLH